MGECGVGRRRGGAAHPPPCSRLECALPPRTHILTQSPAASTAPPAASLAGETWPHASFTETQVGKACPFSRFAFLKVLLS